MNFQTYEKCDKVNDRIELNGKIRLFVPTLQEKSTISFSMKYELLNQIEYFIKLS